MFEIVQTAPVVRHKSRHEYLAPCPSPRNTTPMICRCNAPQLCDIDCRRGPTYLTGQYLHTGQRKYTRRTRMIPTRTARAGTAPSSILSHCPEACRSVDSGACVQATDGPRRIDTSFHGKAVSGPYIVRCSQFERGEHIGERIRAISIRAISGHLLASGF